MFFTPPLQFIYAFLGIIFCGFSLAYFIVQQSQYTSRVLRMIILGIFLALLVPALIALYRFQIEQAPYFHPLSFLSVLSILICLLLIPFPRLLNRVDNLIYHFLVIGFPVLLILVSGIVLVFIQHTFIPDQLVWQVVLLGLFGLLTGFGFPSLRKWTSNMLRIVYYARALDFDSLGRIYERELLACKTLADVERLLQEDIPFALGLTKGEFLIPGNEKGEHPAGLNALEITLAREGRSFGEWCLFYEDPEEIKLMMQTIGHLADSAETVLEKITLIDILGKELTKFRRDHHTHSRIQQSQLASREAERSRIARDLHDGPIQSLIGLNMRLGMNIIGFEKIADPQSGVIQNDLVEIRAEIKTLLNTLRQITRDLRPPMLDILGLGAAVRSFASDWSRKSEIDVQFDLPETTMLESIPENVSVNLFRLVQEALANIQKHAQASRVMIRLFWAGRTLTLEILDNGQGFEVPEVYNEQVLSGHFGLAGMQERAVLIGAGLKIDSQPGEGTRICVTWQPRK